MEKKLVVWWWPLLKLQWRIVLSEKLSFQIDFFLVRLVVQHEYAALKLLFVLLSLSLDFGSH